MADAVLDATDLASQLETQMEASADIAKPFTLDSLPTPEAKVEPEPSTTEKPVETPASEVVEKPADAEPETPTAEQPAEEQPVDEPDKVSDRFRFKTQSVEERRTIAAAKQISDAEGIPFSEAFDRVRGVNIGKADAPAEPEPEAKPDPLDALKTELADVKTKLKAAAQGETLYNEELETLQDRRAELLADIKSEEVRRTLEQARANEIAEFEASQAADDEWASDLKGLEEIFGDAAKDEGALGKAIAARLTAIANNKADPFHSLFHAGVLLPSHVASEVALKNGIQPVPKEQQKPATGTSPAPAQPASKPTQPAARVPSVPLASGAARTTPVTSLNPAQQQAQLRQRMEEAVASGDADRMAALMDGEDTTPVGRGRSSSIRLA